MAHKNLVLTSSSRNFRVSERDGNKIICFKDAVNIADAKFETKHDSRLSIDKNLKTLEDKYFNVKQENDRLQQELANEKQKTQKFLKKLKYIQDNHVVFERLKQAYMNMKYNESTGKNCFKEVSEKSCQCNDLAPQVNEHDSFHEQDEYYYLPTLSSQHHQNQDILVEPGYVAVKKDVFENLKQTIQTFKEMVGSQPLSSFVLSEKREAKYRKDISILFQDNRNLKQLVIDKQLEVDIMRKTLEPKNNVFKKIIAKIAIRNPEIYNLDSIKYEDNSMMNLNITEVKIIEQIVKKYESKIKQKTICDSLESTSRCTISTVSSDYPEDTPQHENSSIIQTEEVTNLPTTPYYTPRTPKDVPQDSDRSFYSIPNTPRSLHQDIVSNLISTN